MSTGTEQQIDVVVVGAGFAGLYMIYRARQRGLSVQCYEMGEGVGGTWYWNRYPGARVDIEYVEYSYSFSKELEQEWDWSERYAGQPEIERYANHVADRFDLRRDIRFKTRVTEAVFDEISQCWRVCTDSGETLLARFCIMATGLISAPIEPRFEGLEGFAGELTTQGAEVDFAWATGIEGLTINGAIALTDAEYSKTFINNEGDDLNGRTPARTADVAGNIGFNFETAISGNWNLGISGAAQFSDAYGLQDVIGAQEQDSFWLYDAGIRLFTADNRYEFALIGRNLGDEVVGYSQQSRPFACGSSGTPGVCVNPPLSNAGLDQLTTTGMGRQYAIQFTYRY